MDQIYHLDTLRTAADELAEKYIDDETNVRVEYWNTITKLAYYANIRQQLVRAFHYESDIKILDDLLLQLKTLLKFGESVYWLCDDILIDIESFIKSNKIK